MHPFARGWRRFRRLPGILQAATWLTLVAAYSLLMVVVLTGGDAEEPTVGTPERARTRPLTAQEREITKVVTGADPKQGGEPTDVSRFRIPRIRSVTCKGRRCDIVYSVGLPGRGRILEDQRVIWERLFTQTDILKATITVTRDAAAAGVPPKQGEETPTGAPITRTTCDRSKRPNVDWTSAEGAQILWNLCETDGFDQGSIHGQEPVAPDDPAANDLELPKDPGR